jgi:hypothetical protein
MKRIALFVAGLALALNCFAEIPAKDKAAIEVVVDTLLVGLRSGDNAAAFAANTPMIREKFETPDNFARVIREHYTPLTTHTSAVVVGVEIVNGGVHALAMLDDGGGDLGSCLHARDRGWRYVADRRMSDLSVFG